jgi:hypothetical protein
MSSAFIPGVAECIELLGGRCDVAGNCKAIPAGKAGQREKALAAKVQQTMTVGFGAWREDDELRNLCQTAIMLLD